MRSNNNVIIIGAGASSLLLSILLSKKNYNVTVFEKNSKAGRKLLATGNGKCNISNKNLNLTNFHSNNPNFYQYAIEQFSFKKLQNLFKTFGLYIDCFDTTKAYPISLQASSVVEILYNEAIQNRVKFIFDSFIEDISYNNNLFIINDKNNIYKANKLIIATGSSAMPKLGSCDSGYKLASKFNHTITQTYPALVQLKTTNKNIYNLSGIKINSKIKLFINKELILETLGDILFTTYGVSGNAILDLSKEASYGILNNLKVNIVVDLLPKFDKNQLLQILQQQIKNIPNKEMFYLLKSILPNKIIAYILKLSNINQNKKIQELNKKELQKIIYNIKNLYINITNTKGIETAEIISGGINTYEIDNKTMQSKLQKGLYFCGEVIDVDGDCGGYNLHWAFASAYICANSF